MPFDPLVVIGLGVVVVVVIVIALRQRGSGITTVASAPSQAKPLPATVARSASTGDLNDQVRQWLANGNKIEAIKRVREHTGMGLKEAKDYVEALAAGRSLPLPPSSTAATPIAAGDLDGQIRQMLTNNQKIQAIKLVREQTGWGLKEAKDYVETLE